MTVEAKAGEALDDLVRDWLPREEDQREAKEKSRRRKSGKPQRLEEIGRLPGIEGHDLSGIRYQLLHRAASAEKEAQRFGASRAVMLVQSFNRTADEESWQDTLRFGELMAAPVVEGSVVRSARSTLVPLYLGWVTSDPAGVGRLEAAI